MQTVSAQRAAQVQVDGRTIYTPSFQYRAANGQTFTVPIIPAESIEQMIRNRPGDNEIRVWVHPNKKIFFVDSGRNHINKFFDPADPDVKGIAYISRSDGKNYFQGSIAVARPELQNILNQSGLPKTTPNWSAFVAKRYYQFAEDRSIRQNIRHEATHALIYTDDKFQQKVTDIWFNYLSEPERNEIRQQWGGINNTSMVYLNSQSVNGLPRETRAELERAWGPLIENNLIHEFGAYLIGNRNYPQKGTGGDLSASLKRKLDMISQQSATEPAFAALNSEKPVQGIASTQQPRPTTGTRNTEPIPQPRPAPRPQPTQQPKPTSQPQPQPQPEPTPQPEPAQQEPLPEVPKEPSFVLPTEPELSNCENIIDCLNNLTKLINFQIFNSLPKEEGKQ